MASIQAKSTFIDFVKAQPARKITPDELKKAKIIGENKTEAKRPVGGYTPLEAVEILEQEIQKKGKKEKLIIRDEKILTNLEGGLAPHPSIGTGAITQSTSETGGDKFDKPVGGYTPMPVVDREIKYTTQAVGEEGGRGKIEIELIRDTDISQVLLEQGHAPLPSRGDKNTTMAVGEEGGSAPFRPTPTTAPAPKPTTAPTVAPAPTEAPAPTVAPAPKPTTAPVTSEAPTTAPTPELKNSWASTRDNGTKTTYEIFDDNSFTRTITDKDGNSVKETIKNLENIEGFSKYLRSALAHDDDKKTLNELYQDFQQKASSYQTLNVEFSDGAKRSITLFEDGTFYVHVDFADGRGSGTYFNNDKDGKEFINWLIENNKFGAAGDEYHHLDDLYGDFYEETHPSTTQTPATPETPSEVPSTVPSTTPSEVPSEVPSQTPAPSETPKDEAPSQTPSEKPIEETPKPKTTTYAIGEEGGFAFTPKPKEPSNPTDGSKPKTTTYALGEEGGFAFGSFTSKKTHKK